MRDKKRVDRVVVEKIVHYCNDIESLIKRFGSTLEKFISDSAFQYSCGMCIIQIGELTTRLSEDFKNKHADIAWKEIKGLRNIHAHDYESLDFEEIWNILNEEIPNLKNKLQKILVEMQEQN
jgi:uncharacterized protein with HEPN domain